MTPQQKIQAAIDALPNVSTGDWRMRRYDPLYSVALIQDMWCIDWSEDQEEVAEGVYGEANATLIAAAKDLAEEVVRLRASTLQGQVERLDVKSGDVVVVRIPGMRPDDAPQLARMLEARFPEGVSALVLLEGQSVEVRKGGETPLPTPEPQ